MLRWCFTGTMSGGQSFILRIMTTTPRYYLYIHTHVDLGFSQERWIESVEEDISNYKFNLPFLFAAVVASDGATPVLKNAFYQKLTACLSGGFPARPTPLRVKNITSRLN